MESVYIADCAPPEPGNVALAIRSAAQALGVTLPQGQSVLLHPACPWVHPRFAPHTFTDPAVIEGAAAALAGNTLTLATTSLPGFPTRYAYRKAGYTDLAKRLGLKLIALDETPTQTVKLSDQSVVDQQVVLPRLALKADFTFALPKLTGSTLVSLASTIRHHQSLLTPQGQLHGQHRLHSKMVDLLPAARPNLIVVDAITATHQGGELSGLPVALGMLIIGTNPVAVDVVCALAYGLNPAEIKYLQLAAERGFGPLELDQIKICGELNLEAVRARARRVERVDPYPDHYPLPPQVKVLRAENAGLAASAGGLTEVFYLLERAGIGLKKACEAVIVIGSVDHVPPGKSDMATILFLDDTARAEYQGYSRVVRFPGRSVPLRQLLNDVPYALKVGNLRTELGEEMVADILSSKVSRLFGGFVGGGR